jgi:hypothetical protein
MKEIGFGFICDTSIKKQKMTNMPSLLKGQSFSYLPPKQTKQRCSILLPYKNFFPKLVTAFWFFYRYKLIQLSSFLYLPKIFQSESWGSPCNVFVKDIKSRVANGSDMDG